MDETVAACPRFRTSSHRCSRLRPPRSYSAIAVVYQYRGSNYAALRACGILRSRHHHTQRARFNAELRRQIPNVLAFDMERHMIGGIKTHGLRFEMPHPATRVQLIGQKPPTT